MAKQSIGLGTVDNDGTGDSLKIAGGKINANFTELYGGLHGLTLLDKTADYTVVQADEGKLIRGDATSGAINFTLPATGSASGQRMVFRKSDGSANRVTVKDSSGTDLAWLSAQMDHVEFFWSGSNWLASHRNIAPLTALFTTSGTSTKPPLAARVRGLIIGAGGGGGSGRCNATSSIRCGGGGGSAGTVIPFDLPASSHGATEAVTIGTGGTGGAAAGTSAANGNPGGTGGNTNIGSLLKADPGLGGGGGSAAASTLGGIAVTTGLLGVGVAGGTANTASSSTNGANGTSGGGGGGGGRDAAEVTRSPGFGGSGSRNAFTNTAGGAASGGAGTAVSDTDVQLGGGGGGGGRYTSAAAGEAGGAGGAPGGGGGGGSAVDTGFMSGAGGAGGRGEVRMTWLF